MKRIDVNSALLPIKKIFARMKLSTLCLLALGLASAIPAHAVFRCVDDKGVTHYGDTMPPQCAKKEVSEISSSGALVRKIDAQLTPEQIKFREAEKTKRTENLRLVAEQKQRDLALLGTYGSEREFTSSRGRDIAQLDGRLKTLQNRTIEIDASIQKYAAEMEFYKAGQSKSAKSVKPREAPQQLINDLARANNDRVAVDTEIAQTDAEKKTIGDRYDEEKARWKRLKEGLAVGTVLDAEGNISITPNGERRPATPLTPATAPAHTKPPATAPTAAPAKALTKK